MNFGHVLRSMRKRKDWTQQQVADRWPGGVTAATVSAHEKGENLKEQTVANYLAALGAEMSEFCAALLRAHGSSADDLLPADRRRTSHPVAEDAFDRLVRGLRESLDAVSEIQAGGGIAGKKSKLG